MPVKIPLLLVAFALAALVADAGLLAANLQPWANFASLLGIFLLLAAIVAFAANSCHKFAVYLYKSLNHYFSAPERHLRRVLFALNRHAQLQQRQQLRELKLHYLYETQRQRLVRAQQREELRALAKAVTHALHTQRHRFPKAQMREFRQAYQQGVKQRDLNVLVNLLQKISVLEPS